MTARYLDGDRPAPSTGADSALAVAWSQAWPAFNENIGSYLLHDALSVLWNFVSEANRFVDREQPWLLAKQARDGDAQAADRLRLSLGDLLEACRLIGLAAAPFMPNMAREVFAQLGLEFGYGPDGNGGPSLDDQAQWGAAGGGGHVGAQKILFPRVEIDPS